MPRLLAPDAADLSLLQDRQVAVLGFGAVAAAHALNLRDSGVDVRVGLPPDSRGAARADMEGLLVVAPEEACAHADVVVVPADEHTDLSGLATVLEGRLDPEDMVLVTAGEPVRYGHLRVPPGVDLVMLRGIGGGERMRSEYLDGRGVPALVDVVVDATGVAWPVLTAYAAALGALRSGAMVVSAAHEAEATRFASLAVHDSVQRLVEAGFETLTEAGVEPELAYLACLHELKERMDLVWAGGFAVEHGPDGGVGRPDGGVVDERVRAALRRIWQDVHDGDGAAEQPTTAPVAPTRRAAAGAAHPLEQVGRRVRAMMSWIR